MEMQKTYWDKEEFEDLVATGIIAMYETKYKKHKWAMKAARLNDDILRSVRQMGCYFVPDDRVVLMDQLEDGKAKRIQQLDIINEGRPDKAILCYANPMNDLESDDSMRKNCYAEISYLEKINGLPKPIKCDKQGKTYRLTKLWMYNNAIIDGVNFYVVIDHFGNIYDTYWIRDAYNSLGFSKKERVSNYECQSEEEKSRAESIDTVDAHTTIQSYQDRRFLWNVTAKEGIAKVTFGVYPEQIKSLFYAREMPMTETGRKRPILHWVAAHQRRIQKGIDVDIEKHLRGINEFVYNGTQFVITQPLKKTKNENT